MEHLLVFITLLSLSKGYNRHQWPLQSLQTEIATAQPVIGFGTWNLRESPSNTSNAVSSAIQSGYRQIDCAAAYGNEKDVGAGIRSGLEKAGLSRGDIWVTSKLWNDQ
jgi:diketogulonate reductase-like aldo/keto reductase